MLHEALGQDAVASGTTPDGTRRRYIIQFKFSSTPSTRRIEASELLDIATALLASSESDSSVTDTRCVLYSNRDLADSANQLTTAASTNQPHDLLGRPTQQTALRKTIADLMYVRITDDTWKTAIATIVSKLGLTAVETRQNVDRLVGHFAERARTPGNAEIDPRVVLETLAGFPKPKFIDADSIEPLLQSSRAAFKRQSTCPSFTVRRRVADDISRNLTCPIVFVHGTGGSGKTTAACIALDNAAISYNPPPFILPMFAADAGTHPLSQTLCTWRNAPSSFANETLSTCLERLTNARAPNAAPVLVIMLDGLDELAHADADTRLRASQLVSFALDHIPTIDSSPLPRFMLIITARDKEDLQLLEAGRRADRASEVAATVFVADFDEGELVELAGR